MSISRETRLNLIVLAVLAVLLTPGAVILVRKQLTATSRSEFLRDPVRVDAAYLDPTDLPSHIRRVVPAPVAAWLRTLPDTSSLTDAAITWRQGLVSLRRRYEVVAVIPLAPGSWRIGLASWDPAMTQAADHVAFNSDKGAAAVTSMRTVDIPDPVRESLKNAGWTTPPRQLGWFVLDLHPRAAYPAAPEPADELTLEAEYETNDGRLVEPVIIPLHPQMP